MRTGKLLINNQEYIVEIYTEERNNATVSIRKNKIIIRVPININREEQFRHILQMKQWAMKKIMSNPERFKRREEKQYKSGDILQINDEQFSLEIDYSNNVSSSGRIINNKIILNISSRLSEEIKKEHIVTLLSRIIAKRRLPILEKKIHELNQQHFQKNINRIFFKNMNSRWGSCSENANINISTRLLFAPEIVLEYVCIHELAHLIEQNHSTNFWNIVQQAIPCYKEQEQWLKKMEIHVDFNYLFVL